MKKIQKPTYNPFHGPGSNEMFDAIRDLIDIVNVNLVSGELKSIEPGITVDTRAALMARWNKFLLKTKDIQGDAKYYLYADEGGMMGDPSFYLAKIIENKLIIAPPYHLYQCEACGQFMKTYIHRLIEMWKMDGKDYLDTFIIKVV